jgi:hypothetical protein
MVLAQASAAHLTDDYPVISRLDQVADVANDVSA